MEDRQPLRLQSKCFSVEVTTNCNNSCSHCFVRARGPQGPSLSPELVRVMVREAYELGYRHLHITGGEPLLWDGLVGILVYAFELGYEKAFLNSNGTLLSAKKGRDLAVCTDLSISISLQGPRHLHDRVRGKGSYDKAFRGAQNAISAGIPTHVFTTVGRSLLPHLTRFAEGLFTSVSDIEQISFIQLIRVPGDVFDLSNEVLRPDDFLRFVQKISLLNLYGLNVEILNNPLAIVAAKVLRVPWLPRTSPLYQLGSIMITADMRITLAHSTPDYFGIYTPGILSTVLMSDDYARAVSYSPVCRTCPYHDLCIVEGMVRPSEWCRDMFSHVPYCRRVLAKASTYG